MEESNLLKKNDVKYIIIHCSDTGNNDTAIDIHKLHISFGWDGIGYHKVICRSGLIENGRPEFWIGAHVRGYNDKSLGVCLIGRKKFTKNQFSSLRLVIKDWKKKYPNAKIVGHYEITNSSKTCPNFNVKKWCEENEFQF